VCEFSRVIFHVQAMDTTRLFVRYVSAAVSEFVMHFAVLCERKIILGDLKSGGQIGVEVVLAVEMTVCSDRATKCE